MVSVDVSRFSMAAKNRHVVSLLGILTESGVESSHSLSALISGVDLADILFFLVLSKYPVVVA